MDRIRREIFYNNGTMVIQYAQLMMIQFVKHIKGSKSKPIILR